LWPSPSPWPSSSSTTWIGLPYLIHTHRSKGSPRVSSIIQNQTKAFTLPRSHRHPSCNMTNSSTTRDSVTHLIMVAAYSLVPPRYGAKANECTCWALPDMLPQDPRSVLVAVIDTTIAPEGTDRRREDRRGSNTDETLHSGCNEAAELVQG
jgi:hypothetical protein